MILKRIMPITLGLAMIAVASVQSYAFMMAADSVPAASQLDVVTMLEELHNEMQTVEATCEEKLSKLDAALEQIDGALDLGVDNEDLFLVAREAIVEMRLELPCQAEQLAQEISGSTASPGATVVDVITDKGSTSGGSAVTGGGGGGGGLLLAGGAAGIIVPLASSDDDAPGTPASPILP